MVTASVGWRASEKYKIFEVALIAADLIDKIKWNKPTEDWLTSLDYHVCKSADNCPSYPLDGDSIVDCSPGGSTATTFQWLLH